MLLNEIDSIFTKMSLKFVYNDPIDNKSTLTLEMARHQTGDKPLTGTLMSKINDTIWYY